MGLCFDLGVKKWAFFFFFLGLSVRESDLDA